MEPTFIVETLAIPWVSDMTFAENVPALMAQFKKERGLKAFKVLYNKRFSWLLLQGKPPLALIHVSPFPQIVIYGPPIVGKTTLAKSICEAYGLVYISPETVAQDLEADLVSYKLYNFVLNLHHSHYKMSWNTDGCS